MLRDPGVRDALTDRMDHDSFVDHCFTVYSYLQRTRQHLKYKLPYMVSSNLHIIIKFKLHIVYVLQEPLLL